MQTLTTEDGTQIHFKDWGQGQPVVFSHGWPLTADAWDVAPIGASAMRAAKLVKGAKLKVHPGLSHGLCTLNKDLVNADLLSFCQS